MRKSKAFKKMSKAARKKAKSDGICLTNKNCKGDCGCHDKGFCGFKCPKNCRRFSSRCYWLAGFGCLKKNP